MFLHGAAGDRRHPGETGHESPSREPGRRWTDAREHRVPYRRHPPSSAPRQDLEPVLDGESGTPSSSPPARALATRHEQASYRARGDFGAPLQAGRGTYELLLSAHRWSWGDRRRRLLPPPGHLSTRPCHCRRRLPPAAPGGRRHRPACPCPTPRCAAVKCTFLDEELRDLHSHARRQQAPTS